MWADANRRLYERRGTRCPSDVTDGEWALIGPMSPPSAAAVGARWDVREMMNGVLCDLQTGCQWPALG